MLEHDPGNVGTDFSKRSCSNNALPVIRFREGEPDLSHGFQKIEGNDPMIRPRRSLLFMPGSNARALEKARNLPADGIILDLEDSVASEAKAMARGQIAEAIAAGGFGKREVLIRVNALDSPWWIDDLDMAGKARPDGILVPKISSVADLAAIADRLSDINADTSIRVWAMIETARAVLHAEDLAAASRDSETRLAGFVFGPNDISRGIPIL